jgi:hypothetical protein
MPHFCGTLSATMPRSMRRTQWQEGKGVRDRGTRKVRRLQHCATCLRRRFTTCTCKAASPNIRVFAVGCSAHAATALPLA